MIGLRNGVNIFFQYIQTPASPLFGWRPVLPFREPRPRLTSTPLQSWRTAEEPRLSLPLLENRGLPAADSLWGGHRGEVGRVVGPVCECGISSSSGQFKARRRTHQMSHDCCERARVSADRAVVHCRRRWRSPCVRCAAHRHAGAQVGQGLAWLSVFAFETAQHFKYFSVSLKEQLK